MSAASEARKVRRELEREGWYFVVQRSGHWRGRHPEAHRDIRLSGSPGSPKALTAMRAEALRAIARHH